MPEAERPTTLQAGDSSAGDLPPDGPAGEATPARSGGGAHPAGQGGGAQSTGEGGGDARPIGQVGAAYDGIAAAYDELVAEDCWMRERLWDHYLRAFPPASRVLDVACGTGLDTLHLAALGRHMTGVDASPGMLAELTAKAAERGLGDRVAVRVADAARLDAWEAGSFDGILSSFAGLNTTDLMLFGGAAARLVRPGGRVVVHLLAVGGVWERLRLVARGRIGAALQLGRRREIVVTIAGRPVRHALHPAGELYSSYFQDGFRLRHASGLGWLWPRRLGARLPRGAVALLGRLDAALGSLPPWRGWSRFLVLDLERRAAGRGGGTAAGSGGAGRDGGAQGAGGGVSRPAGGAPGR